MPSGYHGSSDFTPNPTLILALNNGNPVERVVMSSDGNAIVVASKDYQIVVYSVATFQKLCWTKMDHPIIGVVILKDGVTVREWAL